MKQAIAGVAPPDLKEVLVMHTWPSIGAFSLGRALGSLYNIRWPNVYIFRLGHVFALLSIPLALALYFYRLKPSFFGSPFFGTSYKLTNRRIMEVKNEFRLKGSLPFFTFHFGVETKSLDLGRFDRIDIVRLPGQVWYDCGDLVFFSSNVETFRLAGVSRPDAFRQTCLKSHLASTGVRKAAARQPVAV